MYHIPVKHLSPKCNAQLGTLCFIRELSKYMGVEISHLATDYTQLQTVKTPIVTKMIKWYMVQSSCERFQKKKLYCVSDINNVYIYKQIVNQFYKLLFENGNKWFSFCSTLLFFVISRTLQLCYLLHLKFASWPLVSIFVPDFFFFVS